LEPERNCHSSASRISESQLWTYEPIRCRRIIISSVDPRA
jgi:hypothetical protein